MYVLEPEIVYACRNPTVGLDERGRLHSNDRAAIEFQDGYACYFWHGVTVSADLVLDPESITVRAIEREQNVEIRRIMIERYGSTNFMFDSGAELVARDEFRVLYRNPAIGGQEPVQLVQVTNATPEADDSHKTYFLRVPPTVTTPKEAIAWTFGLTAEEYDSIIET